MSGVLCNEAINAEELVTDFKKHKYFRRIFLDAYHDIFVLLP